MTNEQAEAIADEMRRSPGTAALILARYGGHVAATSRYNKDCIVEAFDDMRANEEHLQSLARLLVKAAGQWKGREEWQDRLPASK